jgi:hypothetical protein
MPEPTRISVLLIAHLHGAIRITLHPEPLRREDPDGGSDVISDQINPA